MSLGAAVGKSTEEKVRKVLPMCSDEFSSLKVYTTICTLNSVSIRRTEGVVHVAYLEEKLIQSSDKKNLKEKDQLINQAEDGRIILKLVWKDNVKTLIGLNYLRTGLRVFLLWQ